MARFDALIRDQSDPTMSRDLLIHMYGLEDVDASERGPDQLLFEEEE